MLILELLIYTILANLPTMSSKIEYMMKILLKYSQILSYKKCNHYIVKVLLRLAGTLGNLSQSLIIRCVRRQPPRELMEQNMEQKQQHVML